jgi:hypothetical protein
MTIQRTDKSSYFLGGTIMEYFDGPMEGVAVRRSNRTAVFFRIVAWDDEYWERVFAVTEISLTSIAQLRLALNERESADELVAMQGAMTPDAELAWDDIQVEASLSSEWSLIESHDLIDVHEFQIDLDLITPLVQLVKMKKWIDLGAPPLAPEFLKHLRSISSNL